MAKTVKKKVVKKSIGKEAVDNLLSAFMEGRQSMRYYANHENAIDNFQANGLVAILSGASTVNIPPKVEGGVQLSRAKDSYGNLCDTCAEEYPACKGEEVEFGNGTGNDNVIVCATYRKSEKEGGE